MFQRLLSLLGFMPSLPSLPGQFSASSPQDAMDVDGSATVSFVPGRKDPLSASEMAESGETPDEQRARITERDLVWPGKTDTIHIGNPAEIAYRYDMTLTDLDPALYVRRPAVGSVWQPEGGTLLQPGEEADFEIVYVAPPIGDKARLRTFSVVLTQFDPRRSADPGVIVAEQPSRWVALPGPGDLAITASPPQTTTRPWRRQAVIAVQLVNRSFLPSSVELAVVRAQSKEALVKEPETVATISQSLPAKTPGVWNILLNSPPTRGSYLATVMGTTRVTEQIVYPLAVSKPVLVRYVPWLRMGRDWLFLVGTFILLGLLIWGMPTEKQPEVRVTISFSGLGKGKLPPGTRLQDLEPKMTLLDKHGQPLDDVKPISGVFRGGAIVFYGPQRPYGKRLFFGWNGLSLSSQSYRITLNDKGNKFPTYDFTPQDDSDVKSYSLSEDVGVFSPWKIAVPMSIPLAIRPQVDIYLDTAGINLSEKHITKLTLNYTCGETPHSESWILTRDGHGGIAPKHLDLTPYISAGQTTPLDISASGEGVKTDTIQPINVSRRKQPFPITLRLVKVESPEKPPAASLGKPPATAGKPPAASGKPVMVASRPPSSSPGRLPTAPGRPPVAASKRSVEPPPAERYLLRNQFPNAIDEVKAQDTPYAHAIQAIAHAQIAISKTKPGQTEEPNKEVASQIKEANKEANKEVALADSGAQMPKDKALVLVAKGWIAFQQKHLGEASGYFNKAVKQDPQSLLAEVSLNAGQSDQNEAAKQLHAMSNKRGLSEAAKLDIMTQYKAAYNKTLDL